MEISQSNLSALFTNFNLVFNQALESAQSHYKDVSMIVPSKTETEVYKFLNNLPGMHEWVGSRTINRLSGSGFAICNKNWEQTIGLDRNDVEDDKYGFFGPLVRNMAVSGASHPDELIFSLLGDGFTKKCYDGQNFFDSAHPVTLDGTEDIRTYSNVFGSGKCAPWFLLDCSRPIRPLIFQSRRPLTFTQKTNVSDSNVFFENTFYYGADARYNVGFGLPQLAFACTAPLTPYNYSVVRAAMMSQMSATGRPLGIKPTHLVTVPGNESAALRILHSETIEATTNEWAGTATPIITQYLMGASGATNVWGNVADFVNPNDSYGAGSSVTDDGKPPATIVAGATITPNTEDTDDGSTTSSGNKTS
ncbi:Mu-like prophage major head subunit gpT [Acetobacter pomorum DSM 11825]|uniref:Mu-like prophage major head subunit gpT family protein n=1 Tax=Acetobacter pomorum TaxID=65959 RepID=UPI0017F44D25|nr:Mu-like prophage major head subunit gpT family protein [Acetobacter pomorum]GBR50057.1 Mu-like prophage major head subunit gpT [Acetobacter pomorum DSM 11825]